MPEATIEIRTRNVEKTDWVGYVSDKISEALGVDGITQHAYIIY
jgi:hypothetical protein